MLVAYLAPIVLGKILEKNKMNIGSEKYGNSAYPFGSIELCHLRTDSGYANHIGARICS
jgi:hypothetical protein